MSESPDLFAMSESPDLLADTPSPPETEQVVAHNSAFRIYRPRPVSVEDRQVLLVRWGIMLDRLHFAYVQLRSLDDAVRANIPEAANSVNTIKYLTREKNCLATMIESFIRSVEEEYYAVAAVNQYRLPK